MAWTDLKDNEELEEFLDTAQRCREAGFIMMHSGERVFDETVQRDLWGELDSLLRGDPAFLRACLDKNDVKYNSKAFEVLLSVPLAPTPEILQDRSLMVHIIRKFPNFLKHQDILPTSFRGEICSKPPFRVFSIHRSMSTCGTAFRSPCETMQS